MHLGVFGGTFDPPHIGHLILAAEALDQLGLDRLLWVLTPDPPHKQGQTITPLPDRLAMLQAALAHAPNFEISAVDMDRPPPHYAVDTVRLLKEQHPDGELIYLMGGDSLVELTTWYRPQEFVAACDGIGVMRRPGWELDLGDLDPQLPGLAAKTQFIQAPLLEISSSQLRQRIVQGRPYRYYLPESVYEIIRQRGFYNLDS